MTWKPLRPKPVKIAFGFEYVKTCDCYPGIERVTEDVSSISNGGYKARAIRTYFRVLADTSYRLPTIQEALDVQTRIKGGSVAC